MCDVSTEYFAVKTVIFGLFSFIAQKKAALNIIFIFTCPNQNSPFH